MKSVISVFVIISLLSASPALAAKNIDLTPMQLQAIQQKEFEAGKPAVFSSVMDVFQDLGYSVGSADMNTGFITAESATTNKTGFWEAMAGGVSSGNTRATAFVEAMPNGRTRVRLNFVSTKALSMGYGQNTRQDKPIQDAVVYQRAFEKVDEALFVRKAVEAPTPVPAVAATATPAQAPAAEATTSPATN
jgi:hypothetical protein